MNNDTTANTSNDNKIFWLKKNNAGYYSSRILTTNEIIDNLSTTSERLSKRVESLEAKIAELEERLDRKEYIIPPDITPNKPDRLLSQDGFIELLRNGKYDKKYIGTIVTLNMTNLTSDKRDSIQPTEWMIIDLDHDIKNYRGTYYHIGHYYDLIAIRGMRKHIFDTYGPNWLGSDINDYLNTTFENGFASYLKYHIRLIKYKSEDEWYTDHVILPSLTELGITKADGEFDDTEGFAYPDLRLFTRDYMEDDFTYWTRTKRIDEGHSVYTINSRGDLNSNSNTAFNYIMPIIRLS